MIDLEILRHIHTYRLTTSEIVANLFRLPLDDSNRILESLRAKGLVGSADLNGSDPYFFLQHKAAQVLRVEKVDAGPINGTAKVQAYASACFCCGGKRFRPLMDARVFRTSFPELYRPGAKINYYTEGAKLGLIRVDTRENTNGDVFRLIERAGRDVIRRTNPFKNKKERKQESLPEFRDLVKRGQFVVTVLTALEQKAERIRFELDQMQDRNRLYHLHRNTSRNNTKARSREEAEAAKMVFEQWHKNDRGGRRRRAPAYPPPLEIEVVPGLLDVMFPKPPQ
ncbi:hypothetical protein V7x_00670 [Crateriforma conspicua]|uniref:Uncharacterized protein n=1 Tax=Crateriforma conspicua TaxID=2527996 RepID=A0A5C6FTL7_9PLAN|nr:hypothetical protein [Crateriforma conspicua]TWU64523.1 hypothetical protein V7x_00670 [Crateriforma conspicua]